MGLILALSLGAWGQASLTPVPKIQFINANAQPLAGGQVFTYAAGTTTPLATYTDYTGTTPNTNPVILDSGGFANIWLGSSCYKFAIYDANSVLQYTTDHVCQPIDYGSSINPLIISAGASGNANFNALRLTEQTSGEFDCDWLKNDGTVNYQACSFYPWFQFPYQNTGWMDNKYTVTFPQYAGGIQSLGRGAFVQLNDPNISTTTLTHNGAGSTGDYMTLRFVDTNSGVSLPITIYDSGGYPSPNSSDTNTLCWIQPGGYSNAIVGRGSSPQTVLNIPGSGVLSGQTAGQTQAPTCFTDNGSYSTTSLATLMGALWPNPDRNTTDSLLTGGILFAQDALNVAGGANLQGAVDLQQIANPGAPTVTVNTTGSTSFYYALVYHDYVHVGTSLGTLVGTSTHVTNSASTPNNTVAWNCYPFSYSVDVVRSTDNSTWYSLPSSLGLPCSSNNNPNGYISPGNATFVDTSNTTTAYPTPARNATGDLYVPGNIEADPSFGGLFYGEYFIGSNNASVPTTFNCVLLTGTQGCDTTKGYVAGVYGDSTHAGHFNFVLPNGTALPLTTDGTDLYFNGNELGTGTGVPSSAKYNVPCYNSTTTIIGCSPIVYSGELLGITASGDQTSNINAAATLVTAIGVGNRIKLPLGTVVASSGPLVLGNVILVGTGAPGWNSGATSPAAASTVLEVTYNNSTTPLIQCLSGGTCGLENIEVTNPTSSSPFMLYTCGIPWLENVLFVGKTAAGPKTNACDDSGPCPVNDGIYFGTAGNYSATCNTTSDGFAGYGANHIQDVYFQNTKVLMALNENANGLNMRGIRSDFTDANPSGYAIQIGETSGSAYSAYGNTFQGNFEQAPYGSTNGGSYDHCNYAEIFGLTTYATNNYITYEDSDVGNCVHSAHIEATSSSHNTINVLTGGVSGSVVLDYDIAALNNTILDGVTRTYTIQQLNAGNIGTNALPVNNVTYAVALKTPASNTDSSGTKAASGGAFEYDFTGTYANTPNCILQDKSAPSTGVVSMVVSNTKITAVISGTTDPVTWSCTFPQ